MTPEQLQQLLVVLAALSKPHVKKTATEADDIGVELLEAIADSPKILEFVCTRLVGNPAAINELVNRIAR